MPTDGNRMTLFETLPKDNSRKEVIYVYVYIISKTKKGEKLLLSESELRKYLRNDIFKTTE